MKSITTKQFILISVIFILLTLLVANFDQQISLIPYKNNVFYGETSFWSSVVFRATIYIIWTIVFMLLIMLIFAKHSIHKKLIYKCVIITYSVMLIGPVLITNVILKDHAGRYRPRQVIRENKEFTTPWHLELQNDGKSFPSGHVAGAACFGIPLIALGYKKTGQIVSVISAILVGTVRWLDGGHYASDIMMAMFVTFFTAYIVFSVYNQYTANKSI